MENDLITKMESKLYPKTSHMNHSLLIQQICFIVSLMKKKRILKILP